MRNAKAEEMYNTWFWACIGHGGMPKMAWDQLSNPEKAAWAVLAEGYLERE